MIQDKSRFESEAFSLRIDLLTAAPVEIPTEYLVNMRMQKLKAAAIKQNMVEE